MRGDRGILRGNRGMWREECGIWRGDRVRDKFMKKGRGWLDEKLKNETVERGSVGGLVSDRRVGADTAAVWWLLS